MITPLVVTIASTKVSRHPATLREWPKAAPGTFSTWLRYDDPTRLDKRPINVRRSVGHKLRWQDRTLYEVHILSWHSQDRLLQSIITQRYKLVSTDSQGGVGTVGRGREGGGSGVVKNKGPNKSKHLNR
jgi:hypothetical protein